MKNDTTKICSVSSCQRGGRLKRGMCSLHYQRWLNSSESVGVKNKPGRRTTFTPDGLKVCVACDEAKELTEFHKDRSGTGGLRARCKTCRSLYMSEYQKRSREERIAYQRERRKSNGDRVRELDRQRYLRDRDKRIAAASDYTRQRRYRMKSLLSDKGITISKLRELHGDQCCYCGVELDFERGSRGDGIVPDRATLEHIFPVSRGGSHTFINTALACHQCNVSKNDKTVEEWEAWKAGGSFGREETTTSGESCKAWRDGTAVLF